MEKSNTFWIVNDFYKDLKEFHFATSDLSFVGYFKDSKLIFILDNTCDVVSPNNLLLIESIDSDNSEGESKIKWDSILQKKFNIDPIKIRPKENTKYKKLDISYIDLSLYNEFIKSQTDELYKKILFLREDLSLQNAFMRESENLLHYNKSSQTLEKANITKQNLETRILNVSKKLKKVQELEVSNSDKFDEVLKQTLVQKLYDNTEKLKRTERRIKRADKKVIILEEELSKNRLQIQELQKRIALRFKQKIDNTKKSLDNLSINNFITTKEKKELNTKILNAKNHLREESLSSHEHIEEATMIKKEDTILNNENVEFKPPVTSIEEPVEKEESLKKRLITKFKNLDRKYLNLAKYVSLTIILLVISILGFYAFIDNSNNTDNSLAPVEQQIVNEEIHINEDVKLSDSAEVNKFNESSNFEIQQNLNENSHEINKELEISKNKNIDHSLTKPNIIKSSETTLKTNDKQKLKTSDINSKAKVVANYNNSIKKKKTVTPKVIKAKKLQPVKKQESKLLSLEQKKQINTTKEESFAKQEMSENTEKDLENIEGKEISKSVVSISGFDIIKKEYIDNVLAGDKYVSIIEGLQDSFFIMQDDSEISKLHNMNTYWNKFRNAVYYKYYNLDSELKDDINFDEYYNDEYLLRKYINFYNSFFENIVNKFVMMYEYTNLSSVDLYDSIEKGLVELGKPSEKLKLLLKIYTSINDHGGSDLVLSSIVEKENIIIHNSDENMNINLIEEEKDSNGKIIDSKVDEVDLDLELSKEQELKLADEDPDSILSLNDTIDSNRENKINNVVDKMDDSVVNEEIQKESFKNDDNSIIDIDKNKLSDNNALISNENEEKISVSTSTPVIVDEKNEVIDNEYDKQKKSNTKDLAENSEKYKLEVSHSEEDIEEPQTLELEEEDKENSEIVKNNLDEDVE